MADKENESTKIIKEYLKKYPDMKKLTLANKIYNENKTLFDKPNDIRQRINRLTGAGGIKIRNWCNDKSFLVTIYLLILSPYFSLIQAFLLISI